MRLRAPRRANPQPAGGLLLLALIAVLILLAYQLWLSYRDQLRTAEISMHNFAAIFETRLDATIKRTDADLKALAREIPASAMVAGLAPGRAGEINSSLDARLQNLDEIAAYRIHNARGDLLYTSGSDHTRQINIADRAYFRRLRDDPGAGLIFPDTLEDRSSGHRVLVMARALRDARGGFVGVAYGMLRLEYYVQQFRSLDLGGEGVVELRRYDNHSVVVRWPESAAEFDSSLADNAQLADRLAAGERVLTLKLSPGGDNVSRLVAVHAMQNHPFYFLVGIGRDDILASWYVQAVVVGVSTIMLVLLLGGLLYNLRRMRRRESGILQNLKKSEAQYRELARMVPVGICHLDRAGRYTYTNERNMAIAGRSGNELFGRDWRDFIHPDDRLRLMYGWSADEPGASAFVCEYRLVRPDGQLTHVIGEVQSELDSDGRVRGYIVAQTDISLRKQVEAELLVAKQQAETANLAKTRFLAAASHDLRQPIQAINLFRDALERSGLTDAQRNLMRFLSMSVRSLGEMLYSLLDISKLDADLVVPQVKPTPVESIFQAIDDAFSTLAQQRNLRFKLFYPFEEMVVLTDKGLLLSVLRNLIDNAFKYTETGGVLVGVRKRNGGGVIQVWDTGIGIDPSVGEAVFDECFQVGNPLHDRAKGLGIGLSIARRMARLLQGDVTYRSRPGKGSVFEVSLPLAPVAAVVSPDEPDGEPVAARLSEEEDSSRVRGWQVVVVEDDPVVAKSIELLLLSLNVKTRLFDSAEAALASVDIMGADFYITDFSLPGLNGLQLLNSLQLRSPLPIRAVLLTGETAPERIDLARASRWRVLFKPADLSQLLAAMNDSTREQAVD